jgi:hypothetical protein
MNILKAVQKGNSVAAAGQTSCRFLALSAQVTQRD